MSSKDLKIIYEDQNVLAVDKPAGIVVYSEENIDETLIEKILKNFPSLKEVGRPPRYGIIHRLDKETSGILLIAKNNQALSLLQAEFKTREAEKEYLALVIGKIENKSGVIETFIGRGGKDRRKQKAYPLLSPDAQRQGKRKAISEYTVTKEYSDGKNNFSLLKIRPKTGRKHQIRVHLAYVNHPVVEDKMYGFKNQPAPKGLGRQFLHAHYLKIRLPSGEIKKFNSVLPEELEKVLGGLKQNDN